MTVYVLSWESGNMETLVFSSFEKARQVAEFIKEKLPSFKVTLTEEEENSLVWHFEYQGDSEVEENPYWEDMTIYPYVVDIGLCYLEN